MANKLVNVLLVEDNPGDELLLRTMLNDCGGFAYEHCERLGTTLERLSKGGIDVILLDLSLPDSHGQETFMKVRAAFPDVALILLTGLNDVELGLKAIREGVQDYLIKGQVDSNWLGRCIRYALERKQSELLQLKSEKAVSTSAKMAAIGQLTGGIAHDFNNMLTVIFASSESALKDNTLSAKTRQNLQMILDAGERAANLTRQLLTFSKKGPGSPVVTDINESLTGLNKILQRSLGEEISLSMNLDEQISKIKIDISQLEQVIMNLCINARDAMPDGGTLAVETKESQGLVILTVKDTGQGMSGETKARIFEPYFTTKEPGKGTGLGLATVFGIVEQANGHIEVQSELGKGTTFEISFPAERGQHSIESKSEENQDLHGTEKILIVEDEESVRNLLKMSLEIYGYKVTIACDGNEGKTIALDPASGGFDIVISDIRMPLCNGRDMVLGIREKLPNIKVVFMSGYSADVFGEEGFQEDTITRFMHKPFSPRHMVGVARQMLDA